MKISGCLGSLLLSALIATQVAAYDHPLGSSAIREAYFMGSGRYAEFLSTYTKNLPVPKTGPHVAQIEVRTPFAQVIVSSHEHSVGYSPMQAEQDYKKNPDTVQVRIQIRNTATYVAGGPLSLAVYAYRHARALGASPCYGVSRMISYEDCFLFFRYSFSQGKEDIKPMSSYGVPIYSGGDGDHSSILVGGDICFTFSTADIASAPFRVTVFTPGNCAFPDFAALCSNPLPRSGADVGWVIPDAQKVSAEFDLAALR